MRFVWDIAAWWNPAACQILLNQSFALIWI
nr:MAG TPA: hypothetical protein [Bacteriophage sp.]